MTDLRLAAVTKTFPGRPPVTALREVDLQIDSGSIVAVLGMSGCGKTTLLRTIAGFERPDRGTIHFGDRLVAGPNAAVPPERRNVGIVPQEGALFPHLDVARNVGFALTKLDRRAKRARVGELLDLVGLSGYERRRPHQLSGGQQQRVALARAMAPRPSVVLLDEPFTALDVSLRARLRVEIAELLRAERSTAILVTHDPGEALAMADRVAAMREGRITQVAGGDEIYRHPVDLDTARLLGDVVLVPALTEGHRASSPLGPIELCASMPEASGERTLLLRPEQIVADAASPVRARVVAVQYNGHDMLVGLEVGEAHVTGRWSAVDLPRPGDQRGIRVAGDAIVIDDAPVDDPTDVPVAVDASVPEG